VVTGAMAGGELTESSTTVHALNVGVLVLETNWRGGEEEEEEEARMSRLWLVWRRTEASNATQ
jgi:hypothetical protein